MAALIFFATAASVLLAATYPAYQMQAKREMEEELIFRGEEYMRAIQKYQRRFGVYPATVDQLISTNGLRFLRRAYKDPVTGKEFRLITVNADGSMSGSKVLSQNLNSQPLFRSVQIFGQQIQDPQQQQPQQQRGQQSPQSPQPQQPTGNQQSPNQQSSGGSFNVAPSARTPVISGGIVGVASDSDLPSIKVYNTRQKYDEWEFIALFNPQGVQGQQSPSNSQQQNPLGQSGGRR